MSITTLTIPAQTRLKSFPYVGSTAEAILSDTNLADKVAIVTGGSSGLGLETARVLSNAGATVVVPARATVREGAYFGAWNQTSGKFAFDTSVGAERLRPLGLHLPAGFFRRRLAWGGITGAIIGSVYALLTREVPVIVLGGILGSVLSLPLAAIEAALEKRRGRQLVTSLNHFALAILIAKS